MNKKFLILLGIFCIGLLNAQVGVNTKEPKGMLHIDPRIDTQSDGSNASDDVIITNEGKLGIGTLNPDALLHMKTNGTAANPITAFRLEDGNEGNDRILSLINNNGLATWQELTTLDAIYYSGSATCPNLSTSTPNYYHTNATIDLAPGRWIVMIIMYLLTEVSDPKGICWINSTLADASTIGNNGQILSNVLSSDIEGANLVSSMSWTDGMDGGTLTGSLVINNTSTETKRYYYMMGGTTPYNTDKVTVFRNPGGYWGEDSMVAFRIPSDI